MTDQWPQRVWYGTGMSPRLLRGALTPASWLFAGVTTLRNRLYDAGALESLVPSLPVLAVGNLSVGGTGKTPVAAWAARQLLEAGARPAIVMRGYGGDEPLVHQKLNPGAVVVADVDRMRGVDRARAAGADCAILDDAFQHRRIRRTENWLLVAAEQWRPRQRCLPAGPLRESSGAMERASLLVVTRKSARSEQAADVAARLAGRVAGVPLAIVHLAPDGLRRVGDDRLAPLARLDGARVLAVAAVGAPGEFFAQLRAHGARVEEVPYRDHHPFDAADTQALAARGVAHDLVVCTLKDAVKLAPLWPQNGPELWYVSQTAVVERGGEALDASLMNLLAARVGAPPTAGSAGPDPRDHGYRSSPADQ
jgi:tetraacyldisaccharide 4'-kinase